MIEWGVSDVVCKWLVLIETEKLASTQMDRRINTVHFEKVSSIRTQMLIRETWTHETI